MARQFVCPGRITILGEPVQAEAHDRELPFLHTILRLPAIFWPRILLTVLGCAVVIFAADTETRRQSLSNRSRMTKAPFIASRFRSRMPVAEF
jgi:hypothetical protein